ncbi:hypothetical protein Bmul_1659 [Burkholderia multivorans ATCC 17616]|nr:hypothetical protein Bmul_1659 [Burkholderia multivorans ATCC 17616]
MRDAPSRDLACVAHAGCLPRLIRKSIFAGVFKSTAYLNVRSCGSDRAIGRAHSRHCIVLTDSPFERRGFFVAALSRSLCDRAALLHSPSDRSRPPRHSPKRCH